MTRGRRHTDRGIDTGCEHDHAPQCRELDDAIALGQLELHYQPVVDLRHDVTIGLEALVRWRHPQLGLLPAGAFVPAAEQCGLITTLDDWVLRSACEQIAAWQHDVLIAPGFRVAVNVSGRDVADHRLAERVADALTVARAAPACLTVELTETCDLADVGRASDTLQELRRMGVLVSLDDFGAAYATFQRLRVLPFDQLKLDRDVIASAHTSVGLAFLHATVELGRSLGMGIVIEGIETADQAVLARDLGGDHGQGYWWARPMPVADVAVLLETGRMPADITRSATASSARRSGVGA